MKGNPFNDPPALAQSTLHWAEKGSLTAADQASPSDPFLLRAHNIFRETVLRPGFSCIGAKAAFHDDAYGFAAYQDLASEPATAGLCRDLCDFSKSAVVEQSKYATFVAVFRGPSQIDELEFEQLLWRQLFELHAADSAHYAWDHSVSSDPNDPEFSFSFAGRAFYVLGMHPASSRITRKFPWPTLVFNPHEQFERLRTDGKWKRMQQAIREREVALQGSVNPMLSDFGKSSEARQYSGRAVPGDWAPPTSGGKCPFGH